MALAGKGVEVTVVYTDCDDKGPRTQFESFEEMQKRYRRLGITLDHLRLSTRLPSSFSDARGSSYAIYEHLKDKDFDAIYFNDCGGQPFYTVMAKRSGVLKGDPAIYVVTHGPHDWLHEINFLPWDHRQHAILAFMERRSVELADAMISPSHYLANWMLSHGWRLPENVFVEQNIVDVSQFVKPTAAHAPISAPKELVFFGRQEVRKGLQLFCDALDRISPTLCQAGVKITIMGKFSKVNGLHSGAYVLQRSKNWNTGVGFLVKYDQEEALGYLLRSRALAIIPSLAENSPCVVAECLQLGIPFVASDSGGTAELVHEQDRAHCLVPPNPEAMSQALLRCLESGQERGRMAIPQAETVQRWIDFHAPLSAKLPAYTSAGTQGVDERYQLELSQASISLPANAPAPHPGPRVSVCLVHFNNPALVNQALASALNQTYSNYEIIIVDDGSTKPEAISNLRVIESRKFRVPVKVVFQRNPYLGAARNAAVRNASGDYFIFLDDDNLLMPTAIEDFVRAAVLMNADIVTGVPYHFYGAVQPSEEQDGEILLLPLGGCAEVGMFENCFGDANALIGRGAFQKVGGFHEDYGQAVEDWQFFATAVLKGLRIEVLPKPSFWYRVGHDGMLRKSNPVQNARRISHLYLTQPIALISRMVEGLLDMDRENSYRLDHVIHGKAGALRDLLIQISRGGENSKESIKGFLDFMVKSGRTSEALEFALANDLDLLEGAVAVAHRENKAAALWEIQQSKLEICDEIDLTGEVKSRARPVAGIDPVDFVTNPAGAFTHPIGPDISVIKAAGVCPTGSSAIRTTALRLGGEDTEVLAALALCAPRSNIVIANGEVVPKDDVSWSGWKPLPKTGVPEHVGIATAEPTKGLMDLYFLTKVAEGAKYKRTSVSWIDASAKVVAVDRSTNSNIEFDLTARRLPRDIAARAGELLTPITDLSLGWSPFVPGPPTLLHPIHGRVAVVRLRGAIPVRSKGARATVSVGSPKSHPIQFGMWLHESARPILLYEGLGGARAFSGWLTVSSHNYFHTFSVMLSEAAIAEMDLYIATRVLGQENVHFCHAYYHEFYRLV